MKQISKNDIDFRVIETDRHNQNPCEGVIREVRRKWFRTMIRNRVPRRLWGYGMRWVCKTMQKTYTQAGGLSGCTPIESVTGKNVDISEYLDFGFYDWVLYHENAGLGERLHVKWLGVSHRIGGLMSYYILTQTGSVISRTTVQIVTNLEVQIDYHKALFVEYDSEIRWHFKEDDFQVEGDKPNSEDWAGFMEFDEEFKEEFNKIFNEDKITEADATFTPEVFDYIYLNIELALPRDGGESTFAHVTKRLKDANRFPIGTSHENPILDTIVYEVEYAYGHKSFMAANSIAMNLFAQVDTEGNRNVLFDEIADHRTDGK